MIVNLDKSVSFVGYGEKELKKSMAIPDLFQRIADTIDGSVQYCYKHDYSTFLCGVSDGFDLIAAEAVLRFREHNPSVQLVVVIPFIGQELGYSEHDRDRYAKILKEADAQVYTSEQYDNNSIQKQDDYLSKNSSFLICYFNGTSDSVGATVNSAIRADKEIINIYYRIDKEDCR